MPTKRSQEPEPTPNHLAVYLLGLEDMDVASTMDDRRGRTDFRVDLDESAWTLERFGEVAARLGWGEVTIGDLAAASAYLQKVAGAGRRSGLRGFFRD